MVILYYVQAGKSCAIEAVLCHGRRQYHILYCMVHIVVSLDRLLVVLIDGELLCRDSGIMVAGFNIITLQDRLPRWIGRYLSTRD
jgi:hypothetical protein